VALTAIVPAPSSLATYGNSPILTRMMYARPGNTNLVLYIHGFASSPANFYYPDTLARNRPTWDAAIIGYPTGYFSDKYPHLQEVSDDIASLLERGAFQKYKSIVVVGSSLGGTIILKSVLSSPNISDRVKAVLLFGSPIGGIDYRQVSGWEQALAPALEKNPQIQDLAYDSPYVSQLQALIRDRAPEANYTVVAITGGADQTVRPWSSEKPLLPFRHVQCIQLPHARHHQIFQAPLVVKYVLRFTQDDSQSVSFAA
jgi:pimeloyl-ACP methyl ester carboxylesterase